MPGPLLAAIALACAACAPSGTEFRTRPPDAAGLPPPGHALYAAGLAPVEGHWDGEAVPPAEETTRSFARILRRAAVFTELAGPEAADDPGRARVTIENRLRPVPSGMGLAVGVEGELVVRVRLPGTGRVLEYRARSSATRGTSGAGKRDEAERSLAREVTRENLRSIVARMRSDRALTATVMPTPP